LALAGGDPSSPIDFPQIIFFFRMCHEANTLERDDPRPYTLVFFFSTRGHRSPFTRRRRHRVTFFFESDLFTVDTSSPLSLEGSLRSVIQPAPPYIHHLKDACHSGGVIRTVFLFPRGLLLENDAVGVKRLSSSPPLPLRTWSENRFNSRCDDPASFIPENRLLVSFCLAFSYSSEFSLLQAHP